MKKYSIYLFFLLAGSFLFSQPSENPLYRALPSLEPVLLELLQYTSPAPQFVPVPFRESLAANWVPTEENFFQDRAIEIAEKKFTSFSAASNQGDVAIPRKIHLIWLGSSPSERVELAIASWKKYHPDWEIKLWTDKDLETFLWTTARSQKVFEQGKNWAEKSDILRLEILYQFGGIYSDTDIICFKSFEPLIQNNISFFAGLESNKIKRFGRPLLGSALIGAAKNSPITKQCIEYTQSAEEAPSIHQHLRSGPGPVTLGCYEALEAGDDTILILPCSYFYPLPWEKRLSSVAELIDQIRPESFAVHLWEGSWFDFYYPPQHPKYTNK